MNKQQLVSVIIPTYNRNDKLVRCIESVFNSTYKNLEVIVVNDSKENKLKKILSAYKVKIINNKKRMFAAYCRNIGAKKARGELLFFLDDDNILDSKCIEHLVANYMPRMGLIGPIMYNEKGELWFYGGKVNWIIPYAKSHNKNEIRRKLIETDVIPNAYMANRKKYIDAGMENYMLFPNFHDDLDIAQKLKINGYKSYILTTAKTLHDYGKVKDHIYPDRLYQMIKCSIIAEKIYAPIYKKYIFLICFLPIYTVYYIIYYIPLKGRNRLALYNSYLNGLIDGLNFNVREWKNPRLQ